MQKANNAYIQTQVATNSPGEVLIMLYDGAINFLVQAKVKMQAKDYAGKGIMISKALDIINELSSSLNKEKGGELSDRLSKIYFWCSSKLAMANLKMDAARIDEVIKVLAGIRSAYAQIIDTPEAQASAATIAAGQRVESVSSHNPRATTSAPGLAGTGTGISGAKRSSAYQQQQNARLTPLTAPGAPAHEAAAGIAQAPQAPIASTPGASIAQAAPVAAPASAPVAASAPEVAGSTSPVKTAFTPAAAKGYAAFGKPAQAPAQVPVQNPGQASAHAQPVRVGVAAAASAAPVPAAAQSTGQATVLAQVPTTSAEAAPPAGPAHAFSAPAFGKSGFARYGNVASK